jgi:hypothetical protein
MAVVLVILAIAGEINVGFGKRARVVKVPTAV